MNVTYIFELSTTKEEAKQMRCNGETGKKRRRGKEERVLMEDDIGKSHIKMGEELDYAFLSLLCIDFM